MTPRPIVALVPMKPLRLAKTRLAPAMSAADRAALSLAMMRNVIAQAQTAIGEVCVIGGDDEVRSAARAAGAQWREDPDRDLNRALALAIDRAFADRKAALYLPSDLPLFAAEDARAIAAASRGGATLTLAPAQRDGGTNAMLIPCGSPFRPALGSRSFARHKRIAQNRAIPFAVCRAAGLAIDIDTPEDLAACAEIDPNLIPRLISQAAPARAQKDPIRP